MASFKQDSILAYLNMLRTRTTGRTAATPTEVGMEVGGRPYNKASAWACSTLKRMLAKGWLQKIRTGRRLEYRITKAGVEHQNG